MVHRLDSPGEHFCTFAFRNAQGLAETLHFSNPQRIITVEDVDDVIPAIEAVEQAVRNGHYAAGYVAYEAAPAFDKAYRVHSECAMPLLWFGIYDPPVSGPVSHSDGRFHLSEWRSAVTPERFAGAIETIREAIARGDTYQTNYTLPLSAEFAGDDYAFFQWLCDAQNSDYCAYLCLGRFRILSASPELFFHLKDDQLVTRPMKGTVARGRWAEEDLANKDWLRTSTKNQAENVMIVDLLRSDLGRIAKIGTVEVTDLFKIETYRTVFQMTSQVSATLPDNTSLVRVFQSLFPSGSITGAPKISTMKLITELEESPRQVYCGAIGYLTPHREAIFNVAIRTVVVDTEAHTAVYGTGGGITWDSEASNEYAEALAKSAILHERWPVFDLLETLCLRDGAYVLLDRHLDRLLSSAAYFSMPVDRSAVRAQLREYAENRSGSYRVRLLVSRAGRIHVEGQPLGETPLPATVGFAREPIQNSDRFLYHKTTHRTVYEFHRQAQPNWFDILLWNENQEVTEFTTGNLVVERDGQRWTPPLACGLLPGTLRADLLERGQVRERVLTLPDVRQAQAIWFINSVRGWVPVTLVDPYVSS